MDSLPSPTALFFANIALRRSVFGPGIRLVTTRPIAKAERRIEFACEIHQRAAHLRPDQLQTFGPLGTIMKLSDQELEQWDGYELEVFGGPVDSNTPDDGHTWTINWAEEDGLPPSKVRLDRQWVHYKDSPVRGELLRIPGQPDQRSIQWLDERTPSDKDLARARDGLALVDGLPRLLRGGGRTEMSRRGARERLLKLADLADAAGDPIEPYALSTYTTRSPRTISYWLERAEWGIEDLRIQLQRYRKRQSARKSN